MAGEVLCEDGKSGLVVLLLIVQFLKLQWARRRLPPGPTPFPILGSLWQLNFKADRDILNKMAEVHGNIFTLWLGHTPAIVLHGFQAVKASLTTHSEEFSGRLETPVFKQLANRKRKSLDPSVPIFHAVSNVICAVVSGHRFLEDETFHQLTEAFDCIMAFGNSFHFFLFEIFPWLMRHLPGPQQKARSCCEFVRPFIRKEIRSHKERGIPDEPQDFIDFYLAQIAKAKDDPTSTYDEDNMEQCIFDLFLAGTETTISTMRWALLYMVAYPNIQEKVQKEMDTLLGPSQLICYEDRKKLPYTNAVIHEIQRYCSIVLIAIPRESGKDTTLQGFLIPKGTIILPNLDSVLFDPEKWESPRQFNPSRFLDKEGNFVNREGFLPFSIGPRVCFGEQLARSKLFIIFTNLLRAFKFTLPKGVKEISTKLVLGSTVQPQPYKLRAVPR
ncbi:cytochrome P450 2J2-like [Eretmochelys imbricata]